MSSSENEILDSQNRTYGMLIPVGEPAPDRIPIAALQIWLTPYRSI